MRRLIAWLAELFDGGGDPQPGPTFVYIEEDGSARELEPDEVNYLNTKFLPGDGGRPYIKTRYNQLTPDKKLWGYLPRSRLPANVPVKALAEATPVKSGEQAIEIAKVKLPMSICVKSGVTMQPVVDPRSGKRDYGVVGVDPRSGRFSATLSDGVWRVVRTPDTSALDVEAPCEINLSARSGRVMHYSRAL